MPITTRRIEGEWNSSPNLRRLRLEFREGTSSKFWVVELENPFGYSGVTTLNIARVHWGRIGSRGSYQLIDRDGAFRRLKQKERNGYQRIGDWTKVNDSTVSPGGFLVHSALGAESSSQGWTEETWAERRDRLMESQKPPSRKRTTPNPNRKVVEASMKESMSMGELRKRLADDGLIEKLEKQGYLRPEGNPVKAIPRKPKRAIDLD